MPNLTQLYNKVSEHDKRRFLRATAPKAEALVWARLRDQQAEGYEFRRQYSVGAFVVNFYCPELRLAVEIDGPNHKMDGILEYDAQRQLFLEGKGITVVLMTNAQVYQNLDTVIGDLEGEGCLMVGCVDSALSYRSPFLLKETGQETCWTCWTISQPWKESLQYFTEGAE